MAKTVKSIKDLFGRELDLSKIDFLFVGNGYAVGKYKGFGLMQRWSEADGYTVVTE